jgi:hypothetical protein
VQDDDGRLWLDPAILDRDRLGDFDVIEWKGRYFELQGRRPSDGWWWIEEVAGSPID